MLCRAVLCTRVDPPAHRVPDAVQAYDWLCHAVLLCTMLCRTVLCCAPELIPQRTACQMRCKRASRRSNSLDNPPYRIHNWESPTDNTATIDWKTMSCTAGEGGVGGGGWGVGGGGILGCACRKRCAAGERQQQSSRVWCLLCKVYVSVTGRPCPALPVTGLGERRLNCACHI
jgi:hypothetical protein